MLNKLKIILSKLLFELNENFKTKFLPKIKILLDKLYKTKAYCFLKGQYDRIIDPKVKENIQFIKERLQNFRNDPFVRNIVKNTIILIKTGFVQFIGIGCLVSFLLFFLNMLFGVSYNIKNFSEDVKNKLGIYFYIQDTTDVKTKDELSARTIALKSELERNGLKVEFYSKKDALILLEKRMPDVIKNFEKYGIDNPLPPTLYVIFDNKDKYEKLKDIIKNYNDIIVNVDDVVKGKSFSEQENRVANIINLTNFLIYFSYFLIFILIVIILSFLVLIIKISFQTFYKQILVEKLLGAYYWHIKAPFLIKVFLILFQGFVMMYLYFLFFISILNIYFKRVFEISLFSKLFDNFGMFFGYLTLEFILIFVMGFFISNFFLTKLIKEI